MLPQHFKVVLTCRCPCPVLVNKPVFQNFLICMFLYGESKMKGNIYPAQNYFAKIQ
jgi:hypothetical protein